MAVSGLRGTRQIRVILYAKEPSFPYLDAETWPRNLRADPFEYGQVLAREIPGARFAETLCLIADDLAAVEQTANVCERRIMEEEKVPVAEKIISLSDSDTSFIVKGDGIPW